ncbi:MAG: sulfatase-like hydrolase/transferase [Limisphaerales bacterium]
MKTLPLLLTLATALPLWGAEKPNILIILADDMGYGDCTAYNAESKIATPNIDRLASEGMLFTDAHSASATCTASRYGLLTGINPARRGVVNGINGLGPVLEAKELTVAEMLKAQGYATRMVGKWHLGFELVPSEGRRPILDLSKPFVGGPLDHGFDSFLGLNSAMSHGPYYYIRDRGSEVMPTGSTKGNKAADRDRRETYAASDLASGFVHEEVNSRLCDEVVGIIRVHAGKDDPEPLFLYYAMLEPHTPWLPEERFGGKSGAGPYGDYMVQLDHELGRVLAALRESGMEKDTLVFFTSDNGALWPDADIEKYGHRANGPLAGGKARPHEGGHRVPFIARWPGRIPAGTRTDALVNHTDFLATFAELLQVDLAKATTGFASIDSASFLPVLKKPDADHGRPPMAVTAGSFRDGEWKLTFTRGPRGDGADSREAAQADLYDLANDLGETKDLSESEPERKAQLFAAYRDYFADAPLKPLAIQFRANKNSHSKPAAKSSEPQKAKPKPAIPDPSSGEELKANFQKRRAELLKQQAALLTEEQRASSEAARKQAIADGKKGMALRRAIDAGANLTAEQKKQLEKLRREMGQLTRRNRERQ